MGKKQNKKKSYEKPKVKSQKIEMGVYGDYNEDDRPPLMPVHPKDLNTGHNLDNS
jgi:hypothetical protein